MKPSSSTAPLRIATRKSQLALWQAHHIAGLLRGAGHDVEIEIIKTTGDRLQEVTFAQVGSKGMFTKEIEDALAEGRVDLAVHSLKDLPTELPEPFELAATPPRVDPRDVFVSLKFSALSALPQGARVGTSSQRRRAQLRALRPDIDAVEFRGNVDTRLRKLAEGGTVQDELITIRGERFVIPVKAEQKRRVSGVVHGASSSGQKQSPPVIDGA